MSDAIIGAQESRDLLMFEYARCNDGYNVRDHIVGDDFAKAIQAFSFLFALLVGVNSLAQIEPLLRVAASAVLIVVGLTALVSYLLDIEGASSVKVALRQRMTQIEAEFAPFRVPQMWHMIDERQRYREERWLKKVKATPPRVVEPVSISAEGGTAIPQRGATALTISEITAVESTTAKGLRFAEVSATALELTYATPREKESELDLIVLTMRLMIVLWTVLGLALVLTQSTQKREASEERPSAAPSLSSSPPAATPVSSPSPTIPFTSSPAPP